MRGGEGGGARAISSRFQSASRWFSRARPPAPRSALVSLALARGGRGPGVPVRPDSAGPRLLATPRSAVRVFAPRPEGGGGDGPGAVSARAGRAAVGLSPAAAPPLSLLSLSPSGARPLGPLSSARPAGLAVLFPPPPAALAGPAGRRVPGVPLTPLPPPRPAVRPGPHLSGPRVGCVDNRVAPEGVG